MHFLSDYVMRYRIRDLRTLWGDLSGCLCWMPFFLFRMNDLHVCYGYHMCHLGVRYHQSEAFSALRGIQRSPVNSPHESHWRGVFMFSFDLHLDKRYGKQSWREWFETLTRPLRRPCNDFLYGFIAEKFCIQILKLVIDSIWAILIESVPPKSDVDTLCISLTQTRNTQKMPHHVRFHTKR